MYFRIHLTERIILQLQLFENFNLSSEPIDPIKLFDLNETNEPINK